MLKRLQIGDYKSGNGNDQKEMFFSEQIIDNSRSMVSIINRSYIYEKVNKPFRSAHNVNTGSIVGKSLGEVWGIETFRKRIKNKLDLCFSGKTVRYEASFTTPVTGKRYYQVVFRPIKTGNGEVTHLMAETFDITGLKESKKITADLKKEIRYKEIEFENRLLQAQHLESIGVFAGGIAHDFNNILATISGYAEMLQDDLAAESSLKIKAEKIISAVNRAKSLTNQVLTFSRQSGLEKELISVNDILSEALDFVRTTASPEIIIKKNLTECKTSVLADPIQLFRVFLNLMTNAMHAMEERGGILSVETVVLKSNEIRSLIRRDILAEEYVLITIRDTGVGMDSVLLQRIFEPYYTTKEVGKGSGLGLSVAYGIVAEMEGEIVVSSKKKSGSVFAVYLPYKPEPNGQY